MEQQKISGVSGDYAWESQHIAEKEIRDKSKIRETKEVPEDRKPCLALVPSCLLEKQLVHHCNSLEPFSNDFMD